MKNTNTKAPHYTLFLIPLLFFLRLKYFVQFAIKSLFFSKIGDQDSHLFRIIVKLVIFLIDFEVLERKAEDFAVNYINCSRVTNTLGVQFS
jgi:hypothetical protein